MAENNFNVEDMSKPQDEMISVTVKLGEKRFNILQQIQELVGLSDKLTVIHFHRKPPILVENEIRLVPVEIELQDNKRQAKLLPFDDYFMLVSAAIWDSPEHSKDAELVTMDKRMQDAAPYNVFFNTLIHCPETNEQLYSIKFTDLLCPSLGKLKCSFHSTFIAQIRWVLSNFAARNLHKLPMTIIHGHDAYKLPKEDVMKSMYPDIDYHYLEVIKENNLGYHHPKLSIFVYDDDSLRVVIGSANMYATDWDIFNNYIWIGPKCPKLPEDKYVMDGESPTGFKSALLGFLSIYDEEEIPSINQWIDRVKTTDFREVKVALIYNVPGQHSPRKNGCMIHYLGHLLSRDCTIPAPKQEHDSWRIVAQTASLGLVGPTPDEWLTKTLLKSLGSHKDAPYLPTLLDWSKVKFSLVYPTKVNVLNGYLGVKGAGCCNYEMGVKGAQPWLLKHMIQWRADSTKRTRAMCHAKNYFRISPCWQKMPYFLLSSSNLSRSGWGSKPFADSLISVRSYEIGILFLPKYFGEEYFEVGEVPDRKNQRSFPMMYDLPLTPYSPDDDSFCLDEMVDLLESDSTSDSVSGNVAAGDQKETSEKDTNDNRLNDLTNRLNTDCSIVKNSEMQKEPSQTVPALVQKRDMKYSAKPPSNNNMFFPFK